MTSPNEFKVPTGNIHLRLDQFLASQGELHETRSRIQKIILAGLVMVNGRVAKANHKLKENDKVTISIPAPDNLNVQAENIPLDVVFEDQDIIVVNKPRGLVVHPAAGNYTGTLVNALLHHVQDLSGIGGVVRPGIVHRLDKDTSGLIVAAKNDLAHRSLADQFRDKKILKQYLALVQGVIKPDSGTIEGRIGRHPKDRKRMAIITTYARHKSREAVTHYRVVKRYKGFTLLELTLETGRTHQIRVHLSSINHPVVGDPVYGLRREPFNVSGQLLHAAKLGFTHPRTGQELEFTAPLPADMERVIKILSPHPSDIT